jgi:hypothetical protein
MFTIRGHLDLKGLGARLDELSELGVTGQVAYVETRPRRRGTAGTMECLIFAANPLARVIEVTGLNEGETRKTRQIHPPRRRLLDEPDGEGGQR